MSPLEFDVRWDEGLGIVRVRARGTYDMGSADRLSEAILDLEGFTPGAPALYDVRGIDPGDIDAAQMRVIASRSEGRVERRGTGKIAVLVSEDLVFGIARMYAVLGVPEGVDMRAFRDLSEAEAWLVGPSEGTSRP